MGWNFRLLLLLAFATSGCVVTARPLVPPPPSPPPHPAAPPPPGPVAPAPRALSRDEVRAIAISTAHSRGYRKVRVKEMEREDDGEWEVELKGRAGGRKAELEMVIDGYDGRILKLEDERDDDDDDDDDD